MRGRQRLPIVDETIYEHRATTPRIGKSGRLLRSVSIERGSAGLVANINARIARGERLVTIDPRDCPEHSSCRRIDYGFAQGGET